MINAKEFTILIVDDVPKNIQVLGQILSEAGYNVDFATGGKEALDWLDEKEFDLVLLDVMMPLMDGFEVCRTIREKKKFDNLPILFLTAKTDKESTVKGFKLGSQDYITKPFHKDELLARVETHLELKHSREILQETNRWLEQKVAERTEELAKANAELTVLDDAKTSFLNLISHEIRTPLNGIMGFLNLLKLKSDKDEFSKYLDLLGDSASRLESFAITALHITNLKTSKGNIKRQNINIKELIQETVHQLNDQLNKNNIEIVLDENGNTDILGDARLISISLVKILDNAIRYTRPGTSIHIHTRSEVDKFICEITDEGPGFSKEFLNNPFILFSPGEQHIDENKGLSLSLVKLIMDAHNGDIELENNEKGACVRLIIRDSSQ